MARIFINYRRAESLKDARHLATLLDRGAFRGRIFIDLKGLDGAPDWLHELERQVAASAAMISIICPGWADVRDADGKRRIDHDRDFVRFELAEAFRRHIPVIPVLVDGARMPRGSELPDNLLYLTRPQAELLRAETFDADCDKIARRAQAEIAARRKRGMPVWAAAAVGVVALAGGIASGPTVWERLGLAAGAGSDERARVAQLRAQLADADAAARSAQAARLKAEGEVMDLRSTVGKLTASADAARKQADEARTQADARAKEILSLKGDLEAVQTEAAKLRAGADARLKSEEEARRSDPVAALVPASGRSARDCNDGCPEMVVVPAGNFTMGSSPAEIATLTKEFPLGAEWWKTEGPQRLVTFRQPFAVSRFEVTFDEWSACVRGGGCQTNKSPKDEGWGMGRRPVINVSWDDAQEYAVWLSARTGKTYRLLSEAEWEYAARAKTTSRYFWGEDFSNARANNDKGQTVEVGQYGGNAWGLHDLHGNAWEWVEDCWHDNYNGAPTDGRAWTVPCADRSRRVLRGGSWIKGPTMLRSANRYKNSTDFRGGYLGFRVARTL